MHLSYALNEAQEQRYQELLKELRCLVCQNQSLAESGAGLADDLRNAIRQMINEGKDDETIKDFAVERYGEFVLYRPRFEPHTYVLWVGPFILLLVGLIVLFRRIRKQEKISRSE